MAIQHAIQQEHEQKYEHSVQSTVKANCGCGFTTTELQIAMTHVEKTGHTLEVRGEIRALKEYR